MILKLTGWRVETQPPTVQRYIAIAAPHTSNWDGYHMIVCGWTLGIKFRWLGKHTLFRFPYGPIFTMLGGIPVIRSKKMGLVEQVVQFMLAHERVAIVVPPEGTRMKVDTWKSGFYHIAKNANLPIIPAYVDYGRKTIGLGPPIILSDHVGADMNKIREFYKNITAKHPEKFAEPRLREENHSERSLS